MSQDTLLDLIRNEARLSPADIAARLGITEEEATERLAKLEADGVIMGYQAVVNQEEVVDHNVSALIEVKVTPEQGGGFDKMARRIAKFDQVSTCYLMSGGYDLMVVVTGKNLREVAGFVSAKLSSMEGVLSTATHFRLKTYKESGFYYVNDSDSGRLSVSP